VVYIYYYITSSTNLRVEAEHAHGEVKDACGGLLVIGPAKREAK
jgi:hypothetical protein